MLFRRKKPEAWWARIRIFLWPRRSWDRSARYVVKRILRLTASPHAVAAGVGAGVAASFLPYIGFHFLIAFALAFVLRGNLLAAALGTFFGNPLTFPLIWASTYGAGRFFLYGSLNGESASNGYRVLGDLPVSGFFSGGPGQVQDLIGSLWETTLWPMTVGAIPLSALFGIGSYVLTRRLASWFRHARLRRLMKRQRLRVQRERRRERRARAKAEAEAASVGAIGAVGDMTISGDASVFVDSEGGATRGEVSVEAPAPQAEARVGDDRIARAEAEAGGDKTIGAGGDMTARAEATRGAGDKSGSGGDSKGGVRRGTGGGVAAAAGVSRAGRA